MAIKGFKDKETKRIFGGQFSPRLPQQIQKKIRMRLLLLHAALTLEDLKVPPSNRLEALSSNRKGQFSIRVNKQYRICFEWDEGNVTNVEVVDYH